MSTVVDDLSEIRALARQFAAEQLRPGVEEWDRERRVPGDVFVQLGELGFLGMRTPEAYGGMALDLAAWAAVVEELAWGEPSVALAVVASAHVADIVLGAGSDEQRRTWLERLASGGMLGCVARAEGAGDAPAVLETRAAPDGAGWVLEGTKRWVLGGERAGVAVVLVRGPDERLAPFLVPTGTPGYNVVHREDTLGLRPADIVTVRLSGARVGGESRLRDDGAVLEDAAVRARIGTAAVAVGIARAAFEHATTYAGGREQFGRPLRAFEGIQLMLADMATRTEAAGLMVRHAAAAPDATRAAMAKVLAGETAMRVTTQAVQIFGGYGYMRDYPVEKLMRDAKATELLEGESDTLRTSIATALYKTAR
jgi:alkylation response protein AidB-like acyl-CoA dehydrogenase